MKQNFRSLALAMIFIAAITFTLREIAPQPLAAPDYDGINRGPEIVVHIDPGMSGAEIGDLLFGKDVVKSSLAYFRASVGNPASSKIAPGEHRLESRIPAKVAIKQLLDPERIVNLVKVRDGARFNEISDAMNEAGFNKNDIGNAVGRLTLPSEFEGLANKETAFKLEGIFYPAFYSFPRNTSADQALQSMIARFQSATKAIDWKVSGFSPVEILTIASLVETEGTPDVFAKVARVIFNRLDQGMKLQFDSTVHYAFNRRGEIGLSVADTKVDSRYNTFRYAGLPPGPIGSPTLAAIEATLAPEPGDWLYFVTVLPQVTKFTSSYDEFLEFKSEYKRNYRAGAFK